MTGHFPVHFTSAEDGKFSVDRSKQDRVMEMSEDHVKQGGTLALFPEGQINRDPSKLQAFRRGSFGLAFKYKLPVYGCVFKGIEDCWPRGVSIGGFPSKIECSLFPISDPIGSKSLEELVTLCETRMQAEVDKMYKANKRK